MRLSIFHAFTVEMKSPLTLFFFSYKYAFGEIDGLKEEFDIH